MFRIQKILSNIIDCNLENILQKTEIDLSHNIDEVVEAENEAEVQPLHTYMGVHEMNTCRF
jgi:hypothetical protein